MKRLIEKGLMFGNLIPVRSRALVGRYNRALMSLTGKKTALADFHIDIAGQSPEIADELGDPYYLNPQGVNRQFILLTTDQKTAPLLDATFSTSRTILRKFIEANEKELFALCAKDAVAGELVNSVLSVDDPIRLFDIRSITVEADTTEGTVETANRLSQKIDRFMTEPDAWYDDVLIAEMIGLSKETGDISRNPVQLKDMTFVEDNFWTSHFGGVYVFRGVEHPAAITMGNPQVLEGAPIPYVLGKQARGAIARFLQLNDLVEPIVTAKGIDSAAILRQKMDFIIADVAAEFGEPLDHLTRRDLRALGRRYYSQLPAEWHGLADLLRWAEDGGPWPKISSDHPAYFYSLRAKDVDDADLINMLLSELSPMDFRQLFICHKQAFYAAYETWPDEKKAYVVNLLASEYQVDKVGTREALFGHEAPMQAPQDMVPKSGPWGMVRR